VVEVVDGPSVGRAGGTPLAAHSRPAGLAGGSSAKRARASGFGLGLGSFVANGGGDGADGVGAGAGLMGARDRTAGGWGGADVGLSAARHRAAAAAAAAAAAEAGAAVGGTGVGDFGYPLMEHPPPGGAADAAAVASLATLTRTGRELGLLPPAARRTAVLRRLHKQLTLQLAARLGVDVGGGADDSDGGWGGAEGATGRRPALWGGKTELCRGRPGPDAQTPPSATNGGCGMWVTPSHTRRVYSRSLINLPHQLLYHSFKSASAAP